MLLFLFSLSAWSFFHDHPQGLNSPEAPRRPSGFVGKAKHKKYASCPGREAYFFKIDALTIGGSTNSKVCQTLQNTRCQRIVLVALGEKHLFWKSCSRRWSQHYFWITDCHEDIVTRPNSGCSSSEGKNFKLVWRFVKSISNIKIIKIHRES